MAVVIHANTNPMRFFNRSNMADIAEPMNTTRITEITIRPKVGASEMGLR
jgi:hypothetical protein